MANEALYREINEEIEGLAIGSVFVVCCECGDLQCAIPLEIERSAYQRVREDPLTFVVAWGHEQPAFESVVEKHADYEVVRKYPSGAVEVAQATDRRLDRS